MSNVVDLLKTVQLFHGVSKADLEALAEQFEERDCPPETDVVKEGATGEEFFVVRSGSVNITRGAGGKQVFLTALGPGESFGEASLFNEMKRTASASTMGDAKLLVIHRDRFREYINQHPISGTRILMQMLREIFVRLQQTSAELQLRHKDGLAQDEIDKILKIFSS